ncbi:uncharacterized protein LOC114254613 [Monomorium pharaonis]|uniref:uncharacterized protein LOC114254613 n=1 Tax=Monomorium pharaonis TaxID=307658 RepID=UPI001746F977|nr:uncharacterized protein LOC114254613 [Monomorium pharaonis]
MSHVKDSQNSKGWLNEVMSKIIDNLGPNIDEARYELSKSISFITAIIYYVRLQFNNTKKGQNEEFSMILKRPVQDYCQMSRIKQQFRNEMLFYQVYGRPDENHFFARCFYVDERLPTDSVIALENVNEHGYYSCPKLYDAPLEYTLAAMRELGRFHGKGYAMKELRPKEFFDFVARLQKVRYVKEKNVFEIIFNTFGTRGVEYLRRQGHDATFCDKMEALLSKGYEVMMKTVEPLEPLSTLCHGDFTLSNVLFKTEKNGQYRAMFIDFALIMYATPVVDLSTYLCICCSNEERREKFSDIMRAYHDALIEYLLDAGVQVVEKYSYNAIFDDFKRGAIFGFIITSYFLSAILGYMKPTVQEYSSMPEIIKKHKYAGGDKVCKIIADMLLHLRDLGCLKRFL